MKLLLVEDHRELAKNIITYLKTEGNICEHASNFREAIDKILIYDYDVIMLDIMLPDGSGLDVLKELREQQSDAGVLIISAKNSLEDKVEGLDLGADDSRPRFTGSYLFSLFEWTRGSSRRTEKAPAGSNAAGGTGAMRRYPGYDG